MKQKRWCDVWTSVLGMLVVCIGLVGTSSLTAAEDVKHFTLVNVQIEDTKIWLPSSVTVQEGDEVELTLDNKLTAPHGFRLEAFGVETVVLPTEKKTIRFTANKAGAYAFVCQLHPAHIGGQVIVQPK